jgi:hypothetical protein
VNDSLEPVAAAYRELAAAEATAIRIDNSGELDKAVGEVLTVISGASQAHNGP